VFVFRDDSLRCTDSETYPLNPMLFTGLPETGWKPYLYVSIDEIVNPEKALGRWLRGDPCPDGLAYHFNFYGGRH
jgi:hypothetical protein